MSICIKESFTYTTTLNPADELMGTFTLFKGEDNVVWSPSPRRDNYYPNVLLLIQNVDVGANFAVEVTGDNLDNDLSTLADDNRWLFKKPGGVTGDLTPILANGINRWYNLETDITSACGTHEWSAPPKLRFWGSSTCAAGKFVKITCYMAG